jgi:nucleoside-diphosphate-sugar epimerase
MKQKNKKIFITGASGRIGSNLVKSLLRQKYKVIALVRNKNKIKKRKNLEVVVADINEIDKYKKEIKKCGIVYHLAAYQNMFDRDIREFERVNVEGTKNILNLLLDSKVERFVYVSTVMVFEKTGQIARNEKWSKKKTGGENYYVETKLRGLNLVNKYKNKIPSMIVYPTIVLDKTDKKAPARGFLGLLWKYLGGGTNGGLMSLVGKKRIENFVLMPDLIRALVNCIDKGKVGEDYILGGENIFFENKYIKFKIPISFLKLFSFIKIIRLIVRNPPDDLCVDSTKAKKAALF